MRDQLASEFQFASIESNTETHIMKILGLGIIFMAVIATESAKLGCSCGFGEGTNPCTGSVHSGIGIRAQKLPKPHNWKSASTIKEEEEQRAQQRAVARASLKAIKGCYGIAAIDDGHEDRIGGRFRAAETLAPGSETLITPLFEPIGDPCYPADSLETSGQQYVTVHPTKPGRPKCSLCDGLQANDEVDKHDHDYNKATNDRNNNAVNGKNEGNINQSDNIDDFETSVPINSQATALRASRLRGDRSQVNSRRGSCSQCRYFRENSPQYSNVRASGSRNHQFTKLSSKYSYDDSKAGCQNSYAATRATLRASGDGHIDDGNRRLSQPSFTALNDENDSNEVPTFEDLPMDVPERSLSFADQERIYNGNGKECLKAPADPVSASIIYNRQIKNLCAGLAQCREKPEVESSLYFGHKKTPTDGREQIVEKNVPEERLHIFDKPIVELKVPPAHVNFKSHQDYIDNQDEVDEQEALEREQLEQEQSTFNSNTEISPSITYSALGFGPAEAKPKAFLPRSSSRAISRSSLRGYDGGHFSKPLGETLPGYEPGTVHFKSNNKAVLRAEEEVVDDYNSEEGDSLTTNCLNPGDTIIPFSQSNTDRILLTESWAKAAEAKGCP